MSNIDGPRSSTRKALSSVIHSEKCYTSPIWYTGIKSKYQISGLLNFQRDMAIRVYCVYGTISTTAVGVITIMPPVDDMTMEGKENYEGVTNEDARRYVMTR